MLRRSLNTRTVYLYVVSFATLMMLIYGVVGAVESLVEFVYPPPNWVSSPTEMYKRAQEVGEEIPLEVIHDQFEYERQNQMRSIMHSRVTRAATNVTLILVALPTYLYHWRRVQREDASPKEG